ncbi:MAG: DUF87 domain-containing protein [Methanomassiliicoccales archaeon]
MSRLHFYHVTIPQNAAIYASTIIERIAEGGFAFRIIIEGEGEHAPKLLIASEHEILTLLKYALAGKEYVCEISEAEVPDSSGFHTALMFRGTKGMNVRISDKILSALLTLGENEKMRIEISVKPLSFRGIYQDKKKIALAVSILYSGSVQSLSMIFPPSTNNRMRKVSSSWRYDPIFFPATPDIANMFIPEFNALLEPKVEIRRRRPLPEGDIAIEGVSVKIASEKKVLRLNSETLNNNFIVFGGTGSGKSTFLARIAASAIKRRRAVLVIDPHGDLTRKIVSLCRNPEEFGKILYMDAIKSPIGLNPFEVFRHAAAKEQLASLISEGIAHVVRNAYGREFWGPRMDYLLKGLLSAVAPIEGSNFADIVELLDNPFAVKSLAEECTDDATRTFLLHTLPAAKDDWTMPIKDKVGRVMLDSVSRRILCQRKGNLDIAGEFVKGRTLLADLDLSRIGETTAALIGAMLLSTCWVVASSVRTGLTIILDEAQLFPPRLIEEIAAQGRKFNVNVIIASQSPSYFEREFLSAAGSNFANRCALRLGLTDAKLAAELLNNTDAREISSLDKMKVLTDFYGDNAELELHGIDIDVEAVERAINTTRDGFSRPEDALPSPFSSRVRELLDILQLVSSAESMGRGTLKALEETGIFQLFPYTERELMELLSNARSFGLVHRSRLRLSQKGRIELYRLQGGITAGGHEHREAVLKLKEILDRTGMLTYLPMQQAGREAPDLIGKVAGAPYSQLFYFEVELSSKYRYAERIKKVERAEKGGAITVFVFDEEKTVINAAQNWRYTGSMQMLLKDNALYYFDEGQWKGINKASGLMEMVTKIRLGISL